MSDLVKLKMLTSLGGPGLDLVRGDPHSCEVAEALRLVEAGFATADGEEAEAALADERERRDAAIAAAAEVSTEAEAEPAGAAAEPDVPATTAAEPAVAAVPAPAAKKKG